MPDSKNTASTEVIDLAINLDNQPPEIKALGAMAIAGRHISHLLVLAGNIAAFSAEGRPGPERQEEFADLLAHTAFHLSVIADFQGLNGCNVLEAAHSQRHSEDPDEDDDSEAAVEAELADFDATVDAIAKKPPTHRFH